jgi:hypothetical protein
MDLSKMMVVCALALGGLALGCSDKCKSACEDQQKCANATAQQKALDCGKFCDDVNNVSDAAKCDDQRDKLLDCEDGGNACSDTACASQALAWSTCVGTFCTAHPTDSNCTAIANDIPSN